MYVCPSVGFKIKGEEIVTTKIDTIKTLGSWAEKGSHRSLWIDRAL